VRDTEPSYEEVASTTEGVNAFLNSSSASHIQFSVHEEADRIMVQVIDEDTQEVVRTIPPKELLDLAAKIGEMVGTLLDQRG
jgi:flagellar protein FlaG